ncbi:hypothetical protein MPLB_1730004 [Mesorhizobium sp. ORS 3324]|nr:hypothetical protein MPLB_1730004 [Mesorhizobium sp. ORS 3324]
MPPAYLPSILAAACVRCAEGHLTAYLFLWGYLWGSGNVANPLFFLVGVAGFEPATPSSRTMCATRLRYTPRPDGGLIAATFRSCKRQWLH